MDAMGRTSSDLYSDCAPDRSENSSETKGRAKAHLHVKTEIRESHQNLNKDGRWIADRNIGITESINRSATNNRTIVQSSENQPVRHLEYDSEDLQNLSTWQLSSSEGLPSISSCSTAPSLDGKSRVATPNSWDDLNWSDEENQTAVLEVKTEWQKLVASLDKVDQEDPSIWAMRTISKDFDQLLTQAENHSETLLGTAQQKLLNRRILDYISPDSDWDLRQWMIRVQLICSFYQEREQDFIKLSIEEPAVRIPRSDLMGEQLIHVTTLNHALVKFMSDKPEERQCSLNIRINVNNAGLRLVLDEFKKS